MPNENSTPEIKTSSDLRIDILEIALVELRRKYDEISSSYDQLRVKVLALIAGEVAIATFLFAVSEGVPSLLSGIIFYFAGIIALGASFAMLLMIVKGVSWMMPSDRNEIKEMLDDGVEKLKFLEKIEKSYQSAINHNLPLLGSRSKLFDKSLMLMIIGVIILIVLKYGKVMVL